MRSARSGAKRRSVSTQIVTHSEVAFVNPAPRTQRGKIRSRCMRPLPNTAVSSR
jgi:acyl-coenzyme A synthetase/AMP-(fatty) acid ligase